MKLIPSALLWVGSSHLMLMELEELKKELIAASQAYKNLLKERDAEATHKQKLVVREIRKEYLKKYFESRP